MKTKHHIRRIVSAIVLTTGFIILVVKTESWLLIGLWCILYLGICGLLIAIDTAVEYPPDKKM